jgi:hypothetical protein
LLLNTRVVAVSHRHSAVTQTLVHLGPSTAGRQALQAGQSSQTPRFG